MKASLYSLALVLSSLELLAWAKPVLLEAGPNGTVVINGSLVGDKDGGSGDIKTGPFADDCVEYCSLSYSPHTYPQPLHYQACRTGCRTAQLDAFIAWPGKPELKSCKQSCHDVYFTEGQQYACSTGCNTPTLDSVFLERSHLYGKHASQEKESEGEEEMDSLVGYMWAALMSQADVFSPRDFEDLRGHAMDMELVVIPYRQFDITILTDDGVYSIHQYSIDSKDQLLISSDVKSSNVDSDTSWMTYRESRRGCIWFRHRMVVTRILMFLSISLAILGVLMCFSSTTSSNSNSSSSSSSKDDKTEKFDLKLSQPMQPFPSSKKAPYDLGSEFLQPIPTLSTRKYGQITMI